MGQGEVLQLQGDHPLRDRAYPGSHAGRQVVLLERPPVGGQREPEPAVADAELAGRVEGREEALELAGGRRGLGRDPQRREERAVLAVDPGRDEPGVVAAHPAVAGVDVGRQPDPRQRGRIEPPVRRQGRHHQRLPGMAGRLGGKVGQGRHVLPEDGQEEEVLARGVLQDVAVEGGHAEDIPRAHLDGLAVDPHSPRPEAMT